MAQFDVHGNQGKLREAIPYVVNVQSDQFADYRRCVVVPLVRADATGAPTFTSFNPTFRIRGTAVILHPLDIVSVPADQLGPRVASLRADGERILRALDELFSRAWD
jgi:toxin CcdB